MSDKIDKDKREFMQAAAAATAAASAVGIVGTAKADSFSDTASRYIPPDQWSHHLELEWYEFPSDDPKRIQIWGYTDKLSYKPGDEVAFHVTTGAATFDIKVYRDGAKLEEVHAAAGVTGKRSPTPIDCYTVGCGWPALYKWKLPANLRSGFYLVIFSIKRGKDTIEQEAGFCVRPGSQNAPIVLMLATSTWRAYNDWGGGSFYGKPGVASGATGGSAGDVGFVPRLTTLRPWARGFMRMPDGASRFVERAYPPRPLGHIPRYYDKEFAFANGYGKFSAAAGWATYDRHFVIWAEKNGYELDFITQEDLHTDPNILSGYKCLVTVGHDEYYTWEMRKAIDGWMENGGHFARLAGNLNWQIRLEDDLTQVAYKDFVKNHDPVYKDPAQRHLLTTMWEHPFVNYPATQTFATSSAFGHLIGIGGASPRTPGAIVYREDHWILEGTDLYYGDAVAAAYVRFECDGLPYAFRDGLPYPTDEFGTPTNIEIVALAPTLNGEDDRGLIAGAGYFAGIPEALYNTDKPTKEQLAKHRRGCGIIGYMPKGKGDIATAAFCEWVYGLGKDEFVDKITHNILKRFTA